MKLQKLLFVFALSFSFITVIQAQDKGSENKNSEEKIPINTKIISKTYKLKGFSKSCCSGIVNYSLKEVHGFVKSEADVNKQRLTVWFDIKKCNEEAIKKAINQTSYKIKETL